MSIDILSYTANKEITYLCTQLSGIQTTLTSKYVCLDQNTATCMACWRGMDSDVRPLSDNSNIICVYDSTYFSLGGSCTWTVPSGVVKARFEIWGPGGTSGAGLCCGGSPWGASGSFMAFTIPVTAGCQYVLCAACANQSMQPYCCGCLNYAQCCYNGNFKASYVSGYGLCNICAPGGCTDFVQNMCARLCRIGYSVQGGQASAPTPTRFVNECYYKQSPNGCGLSICNCYTLCQPGSQPTYAMTPVADWNLWPCGCITVGLCQYHPIYRIPSIHNGATLDTNNYGGYHFMPTYPKCGWKLPLSCTNGGCGNFFGVSSGTCCPYNSYSTCCCCMNIPGLGGGYTHVMSGSTGVYGDSSGRNGFVKVIYSCCVSDFTCAN